MNVLSDAPKGISISLYSQTNPTPIEIDADGCLGDLPWKSVLIEIVVDPGIEAYGFNVTENADVTPSRDWHLKPGDEDDPACKLPPGTRVFRRSVPITESEMHGHLTSKYPNNNIRLLQGLGNGYYQLWCIAVVCQDGEFFLTLEKMYTPFRCYRSGVSVICPTYLADGKRPGWPPFITLLNRVLKGEAFEALPPIKAINEAKPPADGAKKLNGISEGEGRVIWFSEAQQYGMLNTKQGPARIYWREISRPGSRRRYLKSGELVTYTELAKPHLTRARDTGFKLEAVGVALKSGATE